MSQNDMKKPRDKSRNKTVDYFIVYNFFSQEVIGRAADLSISGMMLIADESLKTEQLYKLKLVPSRKSMQGEAVVFIAQVRWCKFKSHTKWWEIGLQICEIEPADAKLLERIIECVKEDETARQSEAGRDTTIPKIEWIKNR